jgi:hypothetical protein
VVEHISGNGKGLLFVEGDFAGEKARFVETAFKASYRDIKIIFRIGQSPKPSVAGQQQSRL